MLMLLKVLCFMFIKMFLNTVVTTIVCIGVYKFIHKLKNVGYGIVVLLLLFLGIFCLLSVGILLDIYLPTNVKNIEY